MNFLDLPNDIYWLIIRYLKFKRVCLFASTCSNLRRRIFPLVSRVIINNLPDTRYAKQLSQCINVRELFIAGAIPSPDQLAPLSKISNIALYPYNPNILGDIDDGSVQIASYLIQLKALIPWITTRPITILSALFSRIPNEILKPLLGHPSLICIGSSIKARHIQFVSPNVRTIRMSMDRTSSPYFNHLTNLRNLIITSRCDPSLYSQIAVLTQLKSLSLVVDTITPELLSLPVTKIRLSLVRTRQQRTIDLTPLCKLDRLRILTCPRMSADEIKPLLAHPNAKMMVCRVYLGFKNEPSSASGNIYQVYDILTQIEKTTV